MKVLKLIQGICTVATLTLLWGCEMTSLANMSSGGDSSNMDGQVLQNPFLQEPNEAADKPNKTEIEVAVAAYGSPQAMPDYMGEATAMDSDPMNMHNSPAQFEAPVPRHVVPVMPVPRSSYRPGYTHKSLGDYTEQMAMDMLQKTKHITPNSRIAIASFVDFSQDLQSTSVLGNQLAESFMAELQAYGLAIVDFKAMPAIQVTSNGDLFFERSGPRGEMQFVLTGTLHRNSRGVQINARIVSIEDQVVVATTKGFIPHFVVSSLTPDYVLMGSR